MDLRFGAEWAGLADAPWAWPFDPVAASPVPPAGGGASPPPPITAVGSRQYVKRVDDLTTRGNTFTQEVAQRLNSLVYRGELRYVADPDVDRRWALDPTASPFWPSGGLTVRASTPGTYGTFS